MSDQIRNSKGLAMPAGCLGTIDILSFLLLKETSTENCATFLPLRHSTTTIEDSSCATLWYRQY
jgi:hypothetical protein